jgi:hypothetical protein
MAKKQAATKVTKATKKSEEKTQDEEVVLSPAQEKAIKLVEKSAKVRGDLEQAVGLAIVKAVRKCMKENSIDLTLPEADEMAAIWFGEPGE